MKHEKTEDRRRFLFKLARGSAFLALGAAIFGGGCKCGEEDVSWSDDDDGEGDTPSDRKEPPPPPPKDDKDSKEDEKDKT